MIVQCSKLLSHNLILTTKEVCHPPCAPSLHTCLLGCFPCFNALESFRIFERMQANMHLHVWQVYIRKTWKSTSHIILLFMVSALQKMQANMHLQVWQVYIRKRWKSTSHNILQYIMSVLHA